MRESRLFRIVYYLSEVYRPIYSDRILVMAPKNEEESRKYKAIFEEEMG